MTEPGWKDYYEDCAVGDRVATPGRTITEADVVRFAALSGDWNPLHTDAEYARTTPFAGRIAHGLLGLVAGGCLLSRVGWFTFWPRSMIAITSLDDVRFDAPIHLGDTICLEAEILEKRVMSDDRGLITTRMQINNQRGQAVITFRLGLIAGRRPAAMLPATHDGNVSPQ